MVYCGLNNNTFKSFLRDHIIRLLIDFFLLLVMECCSKQKLYDEHKICFAEHFQADMG